MQNIPRIYIEQKLSTKLSVVVDKNIAHYLRHVMRRNDCLVFNDGVEYQATLSDDNKSIIVGGRTSHIDPSNDITLFFAPIKRLDDLLNMATQMGVKQLCPVITERTVANHVNWERMKKIIIEAAEQSGRNSVPILHEPIKFCDIDFSDMIVADERAGHGREVKEKIKQHKNILVGPEGGFSDKEFDIMDKKDVDYMSLGKTILRAEVAAVVAISKVLNQ